MIASVHLADLPWQQVPRFVLGGGSLLDGVRGLRYCERTLAAPLSGALLPRPTLRRVGLIAAWNDDEALDDFLGSHPLAERLCHGWHVRLRPLRIAGEWEPLGDLTLTDEPDIGEGAVAVLTLGHLRLSQARRFLHASAAAERLALDQPSLIASTGLAAPPRLVATFSLWRGVDAMRSYAEGAVEGAHRDAMRSHAGSPFHHRSAFLRFAPYGSEGAWDGWNPLRPQAQGLSADARSLAP